MWFGEGGGAYFFKLRSPPILSEGAGCPAGCFLVLLLRGLRVVGGWGRKW